MDIIKELAFCNRYGVRTLYYANTHDGADGSEEATEDCDGCKI